MASKIENNVRTRSSNTTCNAKTIDQSDPDFSVGSEISPHSDSPSSSAAYPRFRPFDPQGELRMYYRNLPHWRQPGATYFVTFRQGDSIPKAILAQWQDIRNRWFQARGIQMEWRRSDPVRFNKTYGAVPAEQRRTFERQRARMLHERLNECHGTCVLRNPALRQIVVDSLWHFHGIRLWLGDFVIMPNHVHSLVQPFGGWELSTLMGSIKRWTSRHIRESLRQTVGDRNGAAGSPRGCRFWQAESYDRIVRDVDELMAFRRYMALDPIKSHVPVGEFTHHTAEWLGPM